MRMTKKLTATVATGAAIAMLGTSAIAQEAPATATSDATATDTAPSDEAQSGRVDLRGIGALWAKGHGRTKVHMHGTYRANVRGDVTIIDHAGDAEVLIDGSLRDLPADGIVLRNFHGRIRLRGSNFEVRTQGHIELHVRGAGKATLVGHGVWKTRNGREGVWHHRDLTLDFQTD